MKNNNFGLSVTLLALAALLIAPLATAQQFGFVQPSFFGDIALSHYGIAAYTAFEQEGDRSAKAQLQSAVQESMQRVGWDLAALDITHRGFEPRQ